MRYFLIKKSKKIGLIILLCSIIYILFSQTLHYKLGNIFFGGKPKMYNVALAQVFFAWATYPIIGKIPEYAHHQLSRTYFIQGDFDKAITEAYKELEIYPDHKATYYIIGLTYGYMKKEKDAIDAFSKYLEYNPESWAGRNDKAWLQFRTGDIDGALVTITPATISQPHNPWVLNTYGILLLNKGKKIQAREILQKGYLQASLMSEDMWGKAYPGNDPRVYNVGLSAMKKSFEENIALTFK